jgi:hypothetical protein
MVAFGLSPRFRNHRFFHALVIYLAGLWVIVKALEVLNGPLDLAPWVVPATFAVLLLGLLIVVMKAGATPPEDETESWSRAIDLGRVLAIGVAMLAVLLGAVAVIVLVYGSEVP